MEMRPSYFSLGMGVGLFENREDIQWDKVYLWDKEEK